MAVMHNKGVFEYPHTKSYEIARIETWNFASPCHCLFILDSMQKKTFLLLVNVSCSLFTIPYLSFAFSIIPLFIGSFLRYPYIQKYDLSPNRNSQKAPNFVFSCIFFKFFENYCFDCHVNLFSQSAIACFIVRYL